MFSFVAKRRIREIPKVYIKSAGSLITVRSKIPSVKTGVTRIYFSSIRINMDKNIVIWLF